MHEITVRVPDGIDPDWLLDFVQFMAAERIRAHEKHGPTSMEQAPLVDYMRAAILGEEALECARALNDNRHGKIELYAGPSPQHGDALDTELVQTAAMAYTWWANRRGDKLSPAAILEPAEARRVGPNPVLGKVVGMRKDELDAVTVTMQIGPDGIGALVDAGLWVE